MAGLPAPQGRDQSRLAITAPDPVLGSRHLPHASAVAPDPHPDVCAGLRHRPSSNQRRNARRSGESGAQRRRSPCAPSHDRCRLDPCRRPDSGRWPPNLHVNAPSAQLPSGPRQPAAPVRLAAGFRLSARGCRQPWVSWPSLQPLISVLDSVYWPGGTGLD